MVHAFDSIVHRKAFFEEPRSPGPVKIKFHHAIYWVESEFIIQIYFASMTD